MTGKIFSENDLLKNGYILYDTQKRMTRSPSQNRSKEENPSSDQSGLVSSQEENINMEMIGSIGLLKIKKCLSWLE